MLLLTLNVTCLANLFASSMFTFVYKVSRKPLVVPKYLYT